MFSKLVLCFLCNVQFEREPGAYYSTVEDTVEILYFFLHTFSQWTPNPYPKDFIQRWELRPPTRSRRSSNNEDLDSGLDSVSVCTKTSEVAEERVAALESELASLKVVRLAL